MRDLRQENLGLKELVAELSQILHYQEQPGVPFVLMTDITGDWITPPVSMMVGRTCSNGTVMNMTTIPSRLLPSLK